MAGDQRFEGWMGACLGCAVKGRPGEARYLHACRDGPVFEASAINWDAGTGP